jgi:phosphatidylserine decarboxylase
LKNLKDFTSFNDFFHRKLKDGTRPIDKMENSVVSPADGKIMAFENIGKTKEIFVKGNQLTLEKLFQNPELSARFVDGTFVSIRLAPVDYHRFHFPYAGKIGKNHTINGYYRSVSPLAIRENFNIFLSNKREYALLETNGLGTIAMFEIGATMVGKISQTYQMGGFVQKGEEKGYFSFGGSTCILIFEKDKFILDADILENTKKNLETKVLMGEKIGIGASFS